MASFLIAQSAAGKSILLTSSCHFVVLCKLGSIRVKAGHIRLPPLLLTDIASWETRWSGFISEAARTLYIKIFQNISWWVCFGFWFTHKQLHLFPPFSFSWVFISRPLKCRFFFFLDINMHAHMGVHNWAIQNNDVIAFIPVFFTRRFNQRRKLRRQQAGGQTNRMMIQTAAQLRSAPSSFWYLQKQKNVK